MTIVDSINTEIQTRRNDILSLQEVEVNLVAAIEQYNKLDEMYRAEEKKARDILEGTYLEDRHYSGDWPIVYSSAQTEIHPYYQGATDDDGNPYYRPTAIAAGDKGISPVDAPNTRSGGTFNRVRSYSSTEVGPRTTASGALAAYPDLSGEPTAMIPGFCTPTAAPDTEAQCTIDGGVWTPPAAPVWVPADTAPRLLDTALTAWRVDLVAMKADVYSDAATETLYQDAIDEIDICIGLLPATPTYPTQTVSPTGPLLTSINALIAYADTTVPNSVTSRTAALSASYGTEEAGFYGIIKLRLHGVNGSFSKLKAAKNQVGMGLELITDHEEAIRSLSLLKVKNS